MSFRSSRSGSSDLDSSSPYQTLERGATEENTVSGRQCSGNDTTSKTEQKQSTQESSDTHQQNQQAAQQSHASNSSPSQKPVDHEQKPQSPEKPPFGEFYSYHTALQRRLHCEESDSESVVSSRTLTNSQSTCRSVPDGLRVSRNHQSSRPSRLDRFAHQDSMFGAAEKSSLYFPKQHRKAKIIRIAIRC